MGAQKRALGKLRALKPHSPSVAKLPPCVFALLSEPSVPSRHVVSYHHCQTTRSLTPASGRQNAVLSMLTLGVLATVASLRVFGKSRVVFWRESAAGISVFSRYLATVLVDLIDITLRPFFFVLVYRSFIYPSITFTCVWPTPALVKV